MTKHWQFGQKQDVYYKRCCGKDLIKLVLIQKMMEHRSLGVRGAKSTGMCTGRNIKADI